MRALAELLPATDGMSGANIEDQRNFLSIFDRWALLRGTESPDDSDVPVLLQTYLRLNLARGQSDREGIARELLTVRANTSALRTWALVCLGALMAQLSSADLAAFAGEGIQPDMYSTHSPGRPFRRIVARLLHQLGLLEESDSQNSSESSSDLH